MENHRSLWTATLVLQLVMAMILVLMEAGLIIEFIVKGSQDTTLINSSRVVIGVLVASIGAEKSQQIVVNLRQGNDDKINKKNGA